MVMESAIMQFYRSHREIRDEEVLASLKDIRDAPGHPSDDELSEEIRDEIRKILVKTHKYDERDVSLAASYVLNSVKRHHSSGGSRGYLEFMDGIFGKSLE